MQKTPIMTNHLTSPEPPSPENSRPIETLPLPDLAACCTCETRKFLAHQAVNNAYCFELVRRAIAEQDDGAWAFIYQHYAPLVHTWVTQHPGATAIIDQQGIAPLINAAFAKFSQAITPTKMTHFDTLPALLRYLKLCTASVVTDEVRSHQTHQREEALDLIEQELTTDDPADGLVDAISAQGLWQLVQNELKNDDERILAELAFLHDMKPGEISRLHPRRFPTADDACRVKRNIVQRLRGSRRLRQMQRLDHL